MGIVDFGAQKLNIAEVPDGHVIISQAQLQQMRNAENNYLSLKAYIPVEHLNNLSKVSELLEKGSRYDTLNQEKGQISTKLSDAETKLQAQKKLPEGYTEERWNKYVSTEQELVKGQQFETLFTKVGELASTKYNIKLPKIDERFYPDKLWELDPAKPESIELALGFLNEAHTEQQKFLSTAGAEVTLSPQVRQGNVQQQQPVQSSGPKDVASETGVHVQHL